MEIRYREFSHASPDGLQLFCREYTRAGAAGTVLCLHGLTRNSRDFEALARRLAARYRVLTPDFRGRGRSQRDADPANYDPGMYAQDMLQLIGMHTGGRVALIGTSLGGLVAMLLGAQVPAAVACIVLNDIGPEIAAAGRARIAGYAGRSRRHANWQSAVAEAKADSGGAFPDFSAADWLAYTRAGYREEADGHIVADCDPRIGDALRSGRTAAPADLWEIWTQLRAMPILAVRGEISDVLTTAAFERMKTAKPDLARVTVPARGHPPLLDEPEVVEVLEPFLARHMA
ncbi:MAG: 2-(acetamidomethylene)succinate hydrolase [Steroidobacteraceae bacterium]|nr:2-(acetamidomethylene)succinate hydrolase [Steroidobacteraceae bacterium]